MEKPYIINEAYFQLSKERCYLKVILGSSDEEKHLLEVTIVNVDVKSTNPLMMIVGGKDGKHMTTVFCFEISKEIYKEAACVDTVLEINIVEPGNTLHRFRETIILENGRYCLKTD